MITGQSTGCSKYRSWASLCMSSIIASKLHCALRLHTHHYMAASILAMFYEVCVQDLRKSMDVESHFSCDYICNAHDTLIILYFPNMYCSVNPRKEQSEINDK